MREPAEARQHHHPRNHADQFHHVNDGHNAGRNRYRGFVALVRSFRGVRRHWNRCGHFRDGRTGAGQRDDHDNDRRWVDERQRRLPKHDGCAGYGHEGPDVGSDRLGQSTLPALKKLASMRGCL